MSKRGGLYLSQDRAFLASLALPRNQLAGAIFAGHHLWWKGQDTVTENNKVKDALEANEDPQKTILLQHGTSTALSGLTKGLDAEMAWSSGHDLKHEQAYFKIKKIGNNSDAKERKKYYAGIFSKVIPGIQKAAADSLFTTNKLVEEYIPRDEEIENLIKHLTPDPMEKEEESAAAQETTEWVKDYDDGLAMDQKKLLKNLANVMNKSDRALAGSEKFSQTMKVLPLTAPLPVEIVEESEEALREYKNAIDALEKEINRLETKHAGELATLIDNLRDLEDRLRTEVENVAKATEKWKELSARFNEYRLDTKKKIKAAREKVRQEKEEALALAKKHSDTLEGLLKACQEHLATFEERRTGMDELLNVIQKEKKKEKKKLEVQIEQLRLELEESDTALKETEGLLQDEVEENKQLQKNVEDRNALEKTLTNEVKQSNAVADAAFAAAKLEKEQNEAEAKKIKQAQDKVDASGQSKKGPKGVSNSWIFPKTRQHVIDSVFQMEPRLQNTPINQKEAMANLTKFTLWSLIFDAKGSSHRKSFEEVTKSQFLGKIELTMVTTAKKPGKIHANDTIPKIFYAKTGPVRLHFEIPGRFIRKETNERKWLPEIFGPHALIGFSVYLQIMKNNDTTTSFFTNLELKASIPKTMKKDKFSPARWSFQIREDGIRSSAEGGDLAGSSMIYGGDEKNVLKALQTSSDWKSVKAHVVRVYLNGDIKIINEWTTLREAAIGSSNKKKYKIIAKNLRDWLGKHTKNLYFVTDTSLTGIQEDHILKTIENPFPSDSGKWMRQTTSTTTPEFW